MRYVMLLAVIGVLLLQWSGAIPQSSVGGPLTIALAVFIAALALAIEEAWRNRRGVAGWIVNIVVALVGAFFGAQAGGFLAVTIIGAVTHLEGSIAQAGEPLMSIALVAGMIAALLGSWAALGLVNRWR